MGAARYRDDGGDSLNHGSDCVICLVPVGSSIYSNSGLSNVLGNVPLD